METTARDFRLWFLVLSVVACGPSCATSELPDADIDAQETVDETAQAGDLPDDNASNPADAPDAAADTLDTAADVPDAADAAPDAGDAWTPACTPDDHPGTHQPEFDGACTGNVGCAHFTCVACDSSCVLCDGPRCVSVVADDSCLTGPAILTGFNDEPVGAVLSAASSATLAVVQGPESPRVLLTAPDEVFTTATWKDAGGIQTRALQPPVTKVADHVLVAGEWTMTNYCTGAVRNGMQPAAVLEVVTDDQGHLSATLPFTDTDPWISQVAWIQVFEDAAGLRLFRWFAPTGSLVFGYGATDESPASATEPIPEDKALPLGARWSGFDWAAALAE